MTSSWRRVRTLVLATLLAALATPVIAGALAAPATAAVPSVESQLLSLTNSDRAKHGLAPLQSSSTLVSIARSWSDHMAATGQLGHNPALASRVSGWSSLGENVAVAASASQAEALFMSSAGHRANILQARYNRVGIGVTKGKDGRYWFTVDFEQTSGYHAPAATAPRPATHTTTRHSTSATSTRAARVARASRSSVRSAVPQVRPASAVLGLSTASARALTARLAATDARAVRTGVLPAAALAGPGLRDDGPDAAAVSLVVCGGLAVTLLAGIATARPAARLRNPFRRAAGG